MKRTSLTNALLLGCALPAFLALGGCGGGGGTASTPTPIPIAPPPPPPPPPSPPPPPPPPPTGSSFNTAEYRLSNGVVQANALPAYDAGATGAGVVAAVIDSGVAENNAEFAGRIHAASADLVGNRGLTDEGGHGTAVASVLLGAKNNSITHGVAFGATLLVAKTDTVDSCTNPDPDEGCSHNDNAIARGVDLAVANRARVINISLGGSPANNTLRAAVDRATAAGVVIVISAGNDFDTDPANAINPDPLAQLANTGIARNQIIIAGALESTNEITFFSNRAGNGATHYLAALGRRVNAIDETGATFRFSGTSFAAPIISGAVALLAQAFPNLTGAQIVDLLLRSAVDLGDPGTDAIFGRGALDIGRAFAPQGATSLAGSAIPFSVGSGGTLSSPMGDATQGGRSAAAVVLDSYGRAYSINVDQTIGTAFVSSRLGSGLAIGNRSATTGTTNTALQLSLSPEATLGGAERRFLSPYDTGRARALAGAVFTRLGARTIAGLGIGKSSSALSESLTGVGGASYLVGQNGTSDWGFQNRPKSALVLSHLLGQTRVSLSSESGSARLWEQGIEGSVRQGFGSYFYRSAAVGVDRRFGSLSISAGLTHLGERETVLGARFGGFAGAPGSRSLFADAAFRLSPGSGWSLSGAYRQGWTRIAAGGIREGSDQIGSDAWSFDVTKQNALLSGDKLGLRVSQPLRVRSGGLNLTLPVAYDYATLGVTTANHLVSLTPSGRELDVEASWTAVLGPGSISTNLFWRRDPGHISAARDDQGAAVRYSVAF